LGLGCWLAVLGCDASHDSLPDSGVEASMPDSSTRDGSTPDAGRPDSSMPDASPPDAGGVDAKMPDGSQPDAALPDGTFSAGLGDDAMVIVEAHTDLQIMRLSCSGWDAVLEKRVAGDWQPLQDDRHPSWNNPGYFLDGEYVQPSFNLGCDVVYSERAFYGGQTQAGHAREYVKTGTRALSLEEEDAGTFGEIEPDDPADVIETREFHGELRVRFKYSLLANCETPQEVVLQLEVP
jgi:hypothetical protein